MERTDRASPSKTPPKRGRRIVRDSFTMPDNDHRLIRELQLVYAREGILFNKGEVLRAGLHALKRLPPAELAAIAERIEHMKSGRR